MLKLAESFRGSGICRVIVVLCCVLLPFSARCKKRFLFCLLLKHGLSLEEERIRLNLLMLPVRSLLSLSCSNDASLAYHPFQ